jgi:exodeoxyribonuclease-5
MDTTPTTTQTVALTERQKWALYQIVNGVREKELMKQTLGGYAGTGKTTLIKYITKFFPGYAVAAYTGKAANVLRKKGIMASTIHSRIYKPFFDNGVMYWDLNPDVGCDGFIIDEASMVSRDIHDDLLSFGLPIIFVGDHGQLEPVESKFNLMEKPDYTLEEIHRNAGDIARFAEHLRSGFGARGFKGETGTVEFVNEKFPSAKTLMSVDQVICAFNKTRVEINNTIRKAKGYSANLVNVGEKIMCLRNNKKAGLFNGMQGTVLALSEGSYGRKYMDFQFDDTVMEGVWYDPSQFGKDTYKFKIGQDTPNPFDYAHCITAHKSQGDEFDSVMVIEQKCKNWEHKRWAYTAASRAKTKLKWKCAYN